MPKQFEIEHVAFSVADPLAMAKWYTEQLGMKVMKALDKSPFTQFIADSAGHVMLEVYNNPAVKPPDYRKWDALLLHIALSVDDVKAVRAKLLAAGATAEGEITKLDNGDELAIVRYPWGIALQLAKRTKSMI